jgi:multiple sugar transport system substrate-binding protein
VAQPYLRIPGAQEYFTNLDIHLSEFFTGQTSLKQALDRTARDWDNTTNKLGRDTQLRYYRQSLGMSR